METKETATDETPAVAINDLVLEMQGRPCLDIPELQIARGESVLIRGENGSGKTTLLRVLSGLITPDNGTAHVLGKNLRTLSEGARDRFRADHIGFIFQRFNLLPYLPAIDNILLPCRFSSKRREQVQNLGTTEAFEAYQLMAQLKLEDPGRLRLQTDRLSIGLQQRVAIARALIGQPDIVLADEPAASLDTASRETVYELLLSYCRAHATTLICISHDYDHDLPGNADNNSGKLSGNKGFDRTLTMNDINRVVEHNPLW